LKEELMGIEHFKDPNAVSWEDMKTELGFSAEEEEEIRVGAQQMIAAAGVRAAAGPKV
jgi:hypothetical protein